MLLSWFYTLMQKKLGDFQKDHEAVISTVWIQSFLDLYVIKSKENKVVITSKGLVLEMPNPQLVRMIWVTGFRFFFFRVFQQTEKIRSYHIYWDGGSIVTVKYKEAKQPLTRESVGTILCLPFKCNFKIHLLSQCLNTILIGREFSFLQILSH